MTNVLRQRGYIREIEETYAELAREYPVLDNPALSPLRKITVPRKGGITVGEALLWPHINQGTFRDALRKMGLVVERREQLVELQLRLDSDVRQKAYKKEQWDWTTELSELSRRLSDGSYSFTLPSLDETKAYYVRQGTGQVS